MPVTDISQLATMTEEQIVALAVKHGYRPYHTHHGDQRILSKPGTQESDPWLNAANDRLFQIQQAKGK